MEIQPEITPGDLVAAMDVLDRLAEESDELPLDDAIVAMENLSTLGSALKRCQSMIETQVWRLLEQPAVVGGRRYKRANRYAKRFDHYAIAHMVADHVRVDRETGELRDSREAVARALNLFIQIYCSDSTEAKQGALRHHLGVGDALEENLAREVRTGTRIAIYELPEEEK
jgi:hypothetical protein